MGDGYTKRMSFWVYCLIYLFVPATVLAQSEVRDGMCPVISDGQVGICPELCDDDSDCNTPQKCCSNGCGHLCMDPIDTTTCDPAVFRLCFDDLVTTALSATEEKTTGFACTQKDFTASQDCVIDQLENCALHHGDVIVSTVRPYVRLLETVYQKACSDEYEFSDCDLSTAKTCMQEYFHILSYGGVAGICKQAALTLDCLKPVLDMCSDLPRYLVAMVRDEIRLTSDRLCYPDSCNLDIGAQLLNEAKMLIDCPVTVVSQSSLVCRKLITTLALVNNHTTECQQSDIPSNMMDAYWHLYKFATDYCGVAADSYMLSNVPSELLLSVYLATVGSNPWASEEAVCKLFNATILQGASHTQMMTTYTEHHFTWRSAMELTIDKYSHTCFNRQMFDCDWVNKQSGVCELSSAEACLDKVFLSKLVVMVNLQLASWQTVCAVAESMMACNQYHTRTCTLTTSPHMDKIQELYNLVGYECSQLGPIDRPDSCDNSKPVCDVKGAITQCGELAKSKNNVCQHKDEVFRCFHEHTVSCKSMESSLAQFYMEWHLQNCAHNFTVVIHDSLTGVSQCRLQYGYDLYNGMAMSSDFNWIVCTATSWLDQCLANKATPSLATLYMDQYSDFYNNLNTAVCNMTSGMNLNPLPQTLTEQDDCEFDAVAGEVSLTIQMMHGFPLMSLAEQKERCRDWIPAWMDTVPNRIATCSPQRTALFGGALAFLRNMYIAYCPKTQVDEASTCDKDWAKVCLEEFGSYAYFANSESDHCGQLQKTYDCLYKYARHCDNATNDALLKEVQAIRGLITGITCPVPAWCDPLQRDVDLEWVAEICQPQQNCLMYEWQSCVEQFGVFQFCSNNQNVASCIQDKLTGCDSMQYQMVKYDIIRFRNSQSQCDFTMTDPALVVPDHYAIQQCRNLFGPDFPSKVTLCTYISQYMQCITSVDQTSVPYVWQAVFGTNVQLWMKKNYLGCQLAGDDFILGPDISRDNFTGSECNQAGLPCLQSLFEATLVTSHFVPVSQRPTVVCTSAETNFECVVNQTAGCTGESQRGVLTSALWLTQAGDNVGTCLGASAKPRTCDPEAAMACMCDAGLDMAGDIDAQSRKLVCTKAQSAWMCVNKHSSSCDFNERNKIEKAYAKVSTLIRNFCTAPAVSPTDMCTGRQMVQCDIERALVCFIPTQAKMLGQKGNTEGICGTIPMLKLCVQTFTSGCDETTRGMMNKRLFRLSARVNHKCPQMFCEECLARGCLRDLYQDLQNENLHICKAISSTKECIKKNAQYCDDSVGLALMQELELLVGDDSRLCEITLQACMKKLMESSFQIMSYSPETGMAVGAQNQTINMASNQDLVYACDQANTAYYCVEHHFSKLNISKKPVLQQTLEKIGDIVYKKCQGPQLQCYTCTNATSNEECNNQQIQTCAANMQACGTVVINRSYLSKGCVSPEVCQMGCYGNTCSFCCQDDYCNQPWNDVLTEQSTCQPLSGLWCGFQLLHMSTQNITNQTETCSTLKQSITCMIESTQTCMSHHSMAMGTLGRQLLASDAVGSCLARNPMCDCGQCTSLLLMTLVSSAYSDIDRFCIAARKLYRQTLSEMDFLKCDKGIIHSTAYNLNTATYMLKGVCSLKQDDSQCVYNNTIYPHGSSFDAEDGCNKCRCQMGEVACTEIMCPPDDTRCLYDGQFYDLGDTFKSDDGCNLCLCDEGSDGSEVSCITSPCSPSPGNFTPNATCEPSGILQCISTANTDYALNGFIGGDNCSSASTMLTCIDPKMSTCPENIKEGIREDIFDNLKQVQDQCDIEDLLRPLINIGEDNLTLSNCLIDNVLQCFNVSQNDTCGEYQTTVDCVVNFTAECFPTGTGPVSIMLNRSLTLLAEECNIEIPGTGPGPNPSPTAGPNEPTNRSYCSYDDKTQQTGNTFRAVDGCNFCYCNMGEVICTSLNCPYQGDTRTCNMTGVEQCIHDTYMAYMVSMATQDGGLQICMSAVQMLRCVDHHTMTCSQNIAMSVQNIVWSTLNQFSTVCSIEQILMVYSQNMTQPGAGDNRCTMQGAMVCLQGSGNNICSDQQLSLECFYNMSKTCYTADMTTALSALQRFFQSRSGCYLEMPPRKDKGHCYQGDKIYNIGENFMDDCNFCFCGRGGMIGCTRRYCGDPTPDKGTCDITEARECIERAAIPSLLSSATGETRHICLSAAEMLRCIEPKIRTCESNAVELVKMAVWANLNMIQTICDVRQLYWLYNNTDTGNHTMPDTGKQCSLQDATECIRVGAGDTACSAYQSMIDCVYKFTVGCLSVDAVPVQYELQQHLGPAYAGCNLVVPLMHIDAAYPIAQCSLGFANALGHEMNLEYLLSGQLDGVCADLDVYLTCLRSADLSTLGRMYASNAAQSVSTLMKLCEDYKNKQVPEMVKCHNCYGATSMEECNSYPVQTCQQNQVCSTGIKLEPNSGMTLIAKGCADMNWCQASYGCNMQYMSCIHCCWGSLCNADNNTDIQTTTAPPVTRPTTPATTVEMVSSVYVLNNKGESCDVGPVSIYMAAHIIRLINFNFIPIQQRGPICQTFEPRLSELTEDLRCLASTRGRVKSIGQWLTNWTSVTCKQSEENPVDETKCWDSLNCLEDFGNFTEKMATCRMLNRTISCVRSNSEYCQDSVKQSVNRSLQLLIHMDYMFCASNPLDRYPEPECVDLQSVTTGSVCNQSFALQRAADIQKAAYNPWMKKKDFCGLMKSGMKSIKDHTYNCSNEIYYTVSPVVAQVIQVAHKTCPDTWCPASDSCKLDNARHCLDSLEEDVQESVTRGYVEMQSCLNVTRTHHCVINATEGCYSLDRQTIMQRFNSLAQIIVPQCQAQAVNTLQCYTGFTQGVNALTNFDGLAISNIVEAIVTQRLYNELYGNHTDDGSPALGGVGLPGVMMSEQSNKERENPYIRNRRDTSRANATEGNPGENSGRGNQTENNIHGSEFWKDNVTIVSGNGTDKMGPNGNGTNPMRPSANGTGHDGSLPTGQAPEMAQSGMASSNMSDILQLLYGQMTHREYIDTLMSLVGMSREQLMLLIDPHTMMKISQHKMDLCDNIHHAYQCLQFNMHMMMVPAKQQYMMSTALDLLSGVAMEMCGAQKCHSCYGLESNELCNKQPVATCQPLEVCFAGTMGNRVHKGCVSALTCEEKCHHSGKKMSCYCCQGNTCNKHTEPSDGVCDVQTATWCVQNMLNIAVMGDPWENATMVYRTAMCLVQSTSGCHSEAYKKIHMTGKHMLALYEAVNCSESYDRAFCNLPGATILAALVASPYQTVTSTEMTCRMFMSVMDNYHGDKFSCCEESANVKLALLSIYNKLGPFCPGIDIEPVCSEQRTRACDVSSRGEVIVQQICEMSKLPGNRNSSGRCDVNEAMRQCFQSYTTDPTDLCPSTEDFNTSRFCLAQLTEGCDESDFVAINALLRNWALLCVVEDDGPSDRTRDDAEKKPANPVIPCLQPLERVQEMLSGSDHLHWDFCQVLDSVSDCLKDTHSILGLMRSLELLDVIGKLQHTFCDKIKAKGHCYQGDKIYNEGDNFMSLDGCNYCFCTGGGAIGCTKKYCRALTNDTGSDRRPECDNVVRCLRDPCDANITTACPAFTEAYCIADYCGGCNTKYFFRGEDVTDMCQDTEILNNCDIDGVSGSVSYYLNTIVLSSVMVAEEAELFCSQPFSFTMEYSSISGCPAVYSEPISAMLSWLQSQWKDICYAHIANYPCLESQCDVSMATELVYSLGYYLRTKMVDKTVLCYQVENVFKALECVKELCDNATIAMVEAMMTDIKPVLHSRCPQLMQEYFCEARPQGGSEGPQGTTPSGGQRTTRFTTRSSGSQGTTTTSGGQRPTSTPGGQRTTTSPDGQRPTTTSPGGQRPATTPGQRPTTMTPGGQRPTTTIQGGQRPTTTTPDGQRTTRFTTRTPGGQGTTTSVTPDSQSGGMGPISRQGCEVQNAKLCLYSAGMPAQNETSSSVYCRNLLEAVDRLADCVTPLISDCDDEDMWDVANYYTGVMSRYQKNCSVDMIRQLVIRVEDGECYVPECSYDEAHNCLVNLRAENNTCGNLDDVANCVELVTAGCGTSQRYINEKMVWTSVVAMLPEKCWPGNSSIDTSQHPILQCIDNVTEALTQHMAGNTTGPSQVCSLLGTLLACLESSSEDQVAVPLLHGVKQLVQKAVPTLQIVCDIDDDDVTIIDRDTARCQADQALTVLRSHIIDALLGPAMTQDGKNYVCGYDDDKESWRGAFQYYIGTCSREKQQDFMMVFNMMEMFGRQTGMCMPNPSICAPGLAVQCIQGLAYKVELHGMWETDQQDICSSMEYTKQCVQQATSSCEDYVHASLMAIMEPVECKAYAICPSMMEDKEDKNNITALPSCISPAGLLDSKNMTCSLNRAMYCLQSLHGNTDKNKTCRNYEEHMKCFITNLSGCDDTTVIYGLSYAIKTAKHIDDMCPTQFKTFCGNYSYSGCDPARIHRCFGTVKAAMETGMEKEMCFAKDQVKQCLEKNAGKCPRVTQQFIETQLLMHMSESVKMYGVPDCESGQQCAYNYITYLGQTLDELIELRSAEEESSCPVVTMSKMEEVYECEARGKEAECMVDSTDNLPVDVAALVNTSLQYVDALFTTVCNAMSGTVDELQSCNVECLGCYREEIRLHIYLPLLLTFDVENSIQDNTEDENYEEFCRNFMDWKSDVSDYEAESPCFGNNVTTEWHKAYVGAMEGLYDKYCDRPCNITEAESCLATLKNESTDSTCVAYDDAKSCLNASIFYCPSNTTSYYKDSIDAVLVSRGVRCYTIPDFVTNFDSFTVLEGLPLTVTVSMPEPMIDECIGEMCEIEISLVYEDPNESICLESEEKIQQILTDKCNVYFQANDSDTTHVFHMFGRVDHIMQPDRNISVNIVARLIEDEEVYMQQVVGQQTVLIQNTDTSGLCLIPGGLTMDTFDGLVFVLANKGEYVLYDHTYLPEKVTARFQSCIQGYPWSTCACSVMIQSGDDVYVLDVCRGGPLTPSLTFKIHRNGQWTPGTKVHYDFDEELYQLVLPSGTIIEVEKSNAAGENNLIVSIDPSPLAWLSTRGLCGFYDNEPLNDLTNPDGSVTDVSTFQDVGGFPIAYTYVNDWRPDVTLLYGVPEDADHLIMDNTKCQCVDDTCQPIDLVETCNFVSGTFFDNNQLEDTYQQTQIFSRRRKRQAPEDEDTIDISQPPVWPTPSNITQAMAAEYCNTELSSTSFWAVCSTIINTTNLLKSCENNILVTDSYNSVESSMESAIVQCRKVATTDPNLSVALNMTYEELVPYILNRTCANDCSRQGVCDNGHCVCAEGYGGNDCSNMLSVAPRLTSLSENIYTAASDHSITEVTQVVEIYGGNFVNTDNLTCHIEEVNFPSVGHIGSGVTTHQSATFMTVGTVRCQVTGTLPLTGLRISVSNNGENQSNSTLYIIQDSLCYNCDVTIGQCNRQPTSCVVNGVCYGATEVDPTDNCYMCDPITNVFQYKTSDTCPGSTTTSTTTVSTTSTVQPTNPSSSNSTSKSSSTSSSSTSTTPSTKVSTQGSTTTTATSSTTSTPRPSTVSQSTARPSSTVSQTAGTTTSGTEGATGRQDDDNDDDDKTTLIVVVSVAGAMGVVIIVAVVCIACKMRKRNSSNMDQSFATSSSDTEMVKTRHGDSHLQGRINPNFQQLDYAAAYGHDQPVVAHRGAPSRSAPFNPQGLHQERPVQTQGSSAMYEDINVGLFDSKKQTYTPNKATHTWEEVAFKIPRPGVDHLYDNTKMRGPTGSIGKNTKPQLDYRLGEFTHL